MNSDDTATDDGKRSREDDEDGEEGLRRSKIRIRTPARFREKGGKMEKVMEMLKTLTDEVREIRKEQKEYRDEVRAVREENEKLRQENKEMKLQVEDLEERINKIEKDRRRNNVFVHGLVPGENDEKNAENLVGSFLKEVLQVEIIPKKVVKVGAGYLIELSTEGDKRKIMANKSRLREVKGQKIYINDDMDKAERIIQATIRRKAKEERDSGKEVKIKFQKMIVNGVVWKWSKEKNDLTQTKN